MSLFARNDVLEVSVSRAHGGCGTKHQRPWSPLDDGQRVGLWRLSCPMCELFLKEDPCWAGTEAKLPETPDEIAVREDQEKRGERETANATGAALKELAGLGQLPAVMGQLAALIAAQSGVALPGQPAFGITAARPRTCTDGHGMYPDAAFCHVCGRPAADAPADAAPAAQLVIADAIPAAYAPQGAPADALNPDDLEHKSLAELKQICQSLGVPAARSKAETLANLRRHYTRA